MKVVEVFKSIQGEGLYMGVPTLFVRLAGCNYACDWCDTKYSWDVDGAKEYTPEELFAEIVKMGGRDSNVCFTGGEPLLQQDELNVVVPWLHARPGISTMIETNGSIIPKGPVCRIKHWVISPKLQYITGEELVDGILSTFLYGDVQLKFVVSSKADVIDVDSFLIPIRKQSFRGKWCPYPVIIQPERYEAAKARDVSFGVGRGLYLEFMKQIISWCHDHLTQCNWRVLPQLHYLLYGDERGI